MRTGATPSECGSFHLSTCGLSPELIANTSSGMFELNLSGKTLRNIKVRHRMLFQSFLFPVNHLLFLLYSPRNVSVGGLYTIKANVASNMDDSYNASSRVYLCIFIDFFQCP